MHKRTVCGNGSINNALRCNQKINLLRSKPQHYFSFSLPRELHRLGSDIRVVESRKNSEASGNLLPAKESVWERNISSSCRAMKGKSNFSSIQNVDSTRHIAAELLRAELRTFYYHYDGGTLSSVRLVRRFVKLLFKMYDGSRMRKFPFSWARIKPNWAYL